MITGLHGTYKEKPKLFNLPSPKQRWKWGNVIRMYKILHDVVNVVYKTWFKLNLVKRRSRLRCITNSSMWYLWMDSTPFLVLLCKTSSMPFNRLMWTIHAYDKLLYTSITIILHHGPVQLGICVYAQISLTRLCSHKDVPHAFVFFFIPVWSMFDVNNKNTLTFLHAFLMPREGECYHLMFVVQCYFSAGFIPSWCDVACKMYVQLFCGTGQGRDSRCR